MNFDDEFDAQLGAIMAEEWPLPERPFVDGVMQRVTERRRRRHQLLAVATVLSVGVAGVAITLQDLPLLPSDAVTPAGIVAAMILSALSAVVWIAAEPASVRNFRP